MSDYLPLLVMIALVVAFVLVSFTSSHFLAPRRPTAAKQAPYECGIVPEEEPAQRFPVKFYLVALTFIVLDVEIIFFYPFSTVFRSLGLFGILSMSVFVLVLLVPFAYLLSVGALSWGPARRFTSWAAGPVLRAREAVLAPPPRGADEEPGEPGEEAA